MRFLLCGLLLAALPLAAEPWPDSTGGRRARAFVEAFNGGERAAILAMIEREFDPADLKRLAAAPRADRWAGLAARVGPLEVKQVREADESIRVTGAARRDGRTWELTIDLAPPPGRFVLGADLQEAAAAPAIPAPGPRADAAAFAATVDEYVSKLAAADLFSGVILVARGDGAPLYHRAFGLADRAARTANQLDTKFKLGSLDKRFTLVAIGQLLEAGRLGLDDAITKHVPDYPRDPGDRITIRHLATMTSGLGDFGPAFQTPARRGFRTLADYAQTFVGEPLLFEPGQGREYSNAGYVVLGRVIESVAGRDYYDHVREAVFSRAGMTDTGSFLRDEAIPNRARNYFKAPGEGLVDNADFEPARGSSAGGGYSTAPDLLRFGQALMADRLASGPVTDWILDPDAAPPAATGARLPRKARAWAGGSPGVNAVLFLDPATRTVIVVLSNLDPPSAEDLFPKLRDWLPR